jgi:two-component system phosphate regulon sensor histidine kinase PhoR
VAGDPEERVSEGGEGAVFDGLAVGVIVLGPDGEVLRRNARVETVVAPTALADPSRLLRRITGLAQRCGDGEAAPTENFEATGPGGDAGVRATAMPLPEGGTVITLERLSSSAAVQERVQQFVAQITHDLRTPLTSILGASDLLLSGRVGAPDDRHARLLKIVSDGTQRLAAQLSDLAKQFVDPEDPS